MTRRAGFERALLSVLTVLALLVLMAAPAGATNKDGHEKGQAKEGRQAEADRDSGDRDGDADSDPDTEYTEDNDTNDGNTPNDVEDDGDNRHPSGKDRSVENGKSASNPNQGKSESDPDDDGRGPDRTNGGPDKPNGSGGFDLADQDGNNGCGNDDDFEDDNEGWCVRGPKNVKPTCPSGTHMDEGTCVPNKGYDCPTGSHMSDGDCVDDDVLGGDEEICEDAGSHPGNKPCEGGSASVTVEVDCYTVQVTSTKDISNVEVAFEDGSVVKFEGLSGYTWTKTFTQAVKWAKAKSGTTVVWSSVAEDCDDDDVEGDEVPCDADKHMPGTQPCVPETPCDADKHMPGTQPCNDDDDDDDVEGDEVPCDADKHMPGTQPCVPETPCDADNHMPGTQPCNDDDDDDDDVEGDDTDKPCDKDATMPGTQPCNDDDDDDDDDVEGDDTDKPCDKDATMPGTQPCNGGDSDGDDGDDDDDVEGDHEVDEDTSTPGGGDDGGEGAAPPTVLGGTVSGDDGDVAAAGERDSNEDDVLGAVLPFTGASLAMFLLAAIASIGGGLSLLRRRKS